MLTLEIGPLGIGPQKPERFAPPPIVEIGIKRVGRFDDYFCGSASRCDPAGRDLRAARAARRS